MSAPTIDQLLLALPIRPDNLDKLRIIRAAVLDLEKDRDDWKRQADLYASSWLRNLGGRIFPKRHHIDALAVTTKHIVAGYERALAVGLITEKRDDKLLEPVAQLVERGWTPPPADDQEEVR